MFNVFRYSSKSIQLSSSSVSALCLTLGFDCQRDPSHYFGLQNLRMCRSPMCLCMCECTCDCVCRHFGSSKHRKTSLSWHWDYVCNPSSPRWASTDSAGPRTADFPAAILDRGGGGGPPVVNGPVGDGGSGDSGHSGRDRGRRGSGNTDGVPGSLACIDQSTGESETYQDVHSKT